jgi:hypothetical protein
MEVHDFIGLSQFRDTGSVAGAWSV